MKQSNWILGIGIIVALVLIVGSIWITSVNPDDTGTVLQKSTPNIGQTINKVGLKTIRPVASIINALF